MTQLQTDQALLTAMQEASARGFTADEARQQRVSFVIGSLSDKNDMTREEIEKIINKSSGGTEKK